MASMVCSTTMAVGWGRGGVLSTAHPSSVKTQCTPSHSSDFGHCQGVTGPPSPTHPSNHHCPVSKYCPLPPIPQITIVLCQSIALFHPPLKSPLSCVKVLPSSTQSSNHHCPVSEYCPLPHHPSDYQWLVSRSGIIVLLYAQPLDLEKCYQLTKTNFSLKTSMFFIFFFHVTSLLVWYEVVAY